MEELSMALDLAFEKLTNVKGYKIKHIKTGFYFRPTNGFRGAVEKKPSLSKRGKIYKKRPCFPAHYRGMDGETKAASPNDWEIELIRIKEDE